MDAIMASWHEPETRPLVPAHRGSDRRSFFRRYDISGAVRDVFYFDLVGTQNCPNGSLGYFIYDNRGLLFQVQVQTCAYGATPFSYLRNT